MGMGKRIHKAFGAGTCPPRKQAVKMCRAKSHMGRNGFQVRSVQPMIVQKAKGFGDAFIIISICAHGVNLAIIDLCATRILLFKKNLLRAPLRALRYRCRKQEGEKPMSAIGHTPVAGPDRRRKHRGDKDRRQQSRHLWFLNATFDRVDFAQTAARISDRPPGSAFKFVVTPNVDHLVRLQTESNWVRQLYAQAWLTVCDSRILELIAFISGEKVAVTPGSDLTRYLFETSIDPTETVTIIGANAKAIETVTQEYGLKDVRWYEPPMGLRHNLLAIEQCAEFIFKNPARFTFICVGSPQQEMIARSCLRRGDCEGTALCVGASLDFLAGKVRRAPQWMQRMRLEWLYRLLSEPKRMWRRYLVDGPKIAFVWWEWRKAKAQLKRLEKLVQSGVFNDE